MSNLGVGVYFLFVIWFITLLLFWVSVRTGHFIGKVSVVIATAITIIIFSLPKGNLEDSQLANFYDKTFVPRYVTLSLLLVSFVVGCVFTFVYSCLTPVETHKIKSFGANK